MLLSRCCCSQRKEKEGPDSGQVYRFARNGDADSIIAHRRNESAARYRSPVRLNARLSSFPLAFYAKRRCRAILARESLR